MTTIAADRAKNELDALLDRVEGGEQITITRNGRELARLVPVASVETPASPQRAAQVERIIEQLHEHRQGNRLGPDLTIKQLIEEGRP